MTLEQLTSAIYNNLVAGQQGSKFLPLISLEQIEDDIIDERLLILKEYGAKNMLPKRDLLMSINCIELDCKSLDKCPCGASYTKPLQHFEIPQLLNDFGEDAIEFIGSVDREVQFVTYTSTSYQMHKYKRRGANKPYVYIDTTPNENNFYDCWVFNSPLLKRLSVIAIFKDPRQLLQYNCCNDEHTINFNFIDNEIKRRLSEKYLRYYSRVPVQSQIETK
jgi:hypothetical protein